MVQKHLKHNGLPGFPLIFCEPLCTRHKTFLLPICFVVGLIHMPQSLNLKVEIFLLYDRNVMKNKRDHILAHKKCLKIAQISVSTQSLPSHKINCPPPCPHRPPRMYQSSQLRKITLRQGSLTFLPPIPFQNTTSHKSTLYF